MIEDFGFDVFLGRVKIDGESDIKYVSLNLKNHASIIFNAFDIIFYALRDFAKEDMKLLLYKSPGFRPSKTTNLKDVNNFIDRIVQDVDIGDVSGKVLPQGYDLGKNTLLTPRQEYLVMSPKEIRSLKHWYNQIPEMKNYLNPFEYQPN